MAKHILEVIEFRVKHNITDDIFLVAVDTTSNFVSSLDGFIERQIAKRKNGVWVDIVKWKNMQAAIEAAKQFESSEEVREFVMMIDHSSIKKHHFEITKETQNEERGKERFFEHHQGFEVSFFRPKKDVKDADIISACISMEKELLSKEKGFVSHKIIKISDDIYADVALADTKQDAIRICNSWPGNSYAEAFLDLIEPVNFEGLEVLNFGEVIHSHSQ